MDDPDPELVRVARLSPLELAKAMADVKFALQKLCDRTLRGMFDGPTNVTVDWVNGPGVVLDLSAVYDDPEVLAAGDAGRDRTGSARRCATPAARSCRSSTRRGPRCATAPTTSSRREAVPPVRGGDRAGLPPAPDLSAQHDDGTAAPKIAAGLLADIETRVLLRQPAEEIPAMAELFDLSDREQQMLRRCRPAGPSGRSAAAPRSSRPFAHRSRRSCSTPTRR